MERFLIKFTKTGGTKFISHLDTMRTLTRTMRRAEIPIEYSKGFNPHPSISIAAPLSLGVSSVAEYADIELYEEMNKKEIIEKMNINLPIGMKVVGLVKVEGKKASSMGSVTAALYNIKFQNNGLTKDLAEKLIEEILQAKSIMKNKKTKSGEKLTDLRPFILEIELNDFNEKLIEFKVLLRSGSTGNLNAEAMAEIIKDFSKGGVFGFPSIERQEIYASSSKGLVDLISYFAGK